MSHSEPFVQHHRRQTGCAIHHAYSQLASDSAKFRELLHLVRQRAPRFLEAPVTNGHHPAVDALANLSRFHRAHIRLPSAWPGTSESWRCAVSSLAQHLISKYELPAFLASSWYAAADPSADTKRSWVIAHARGVSFRSLPLPIAMTRKMEHVFLRSPHHLAIAPALRRAELLALGVPVPLTQAVLATRLATDLTNGEFWRTVWFFLIAHANHLDPDQVAPMIDFIQAIRHDRALVETPNGMVETHPPRPEFSMKGRTAQSMLCLMRDWHRSLKASAIGLSWTPSPYQSMLVEEPSLENSAPPKLWQMLELTNGAQLRTEGAALHHCVASYAGRCRLGVSRIWSLRLRRGEKVQHVLTVEIDPKRRAIVQSRGRANRAASGKPLRLLRDWAVRERLQMAI